MVEDLYPRMGFRREPEEAAADGRVFELETKTFHPFATHINLLCKAYEPSQRS